MVRVLAVNNYPTTERFERLRRCLEINGAEVAVTDRRGCSASAFDGYDGVVLSGSPDMASTGAARAKYSAEIEAIRETRAPVLGVCFGHQLAAIAFGSKVVKDVRPVVEFVRTEVVAADPLFGGLPKSIMLVESRHEVVESLPTGFGLIARSETSKIAAMKHRTLPIYGVQSHPERYTSENPEGNRLVGNFVGLLR
jgi:GMP synthase-like glutamine amidotransferase